MLIDQRGWLRLLIDPFLTDNPKGVASADEVEADVIALTHGHFDHLGDTVDIARRTGATVVAARAFKADVENATSSEAVVLDPGDSHSL